MKVSVNQYARTLLELTDGKTEQQISDVVKKFASVIKRDGQLKNIAKITEKFSEIYNAKHGVVEVCVTTGKKIGASEMEKVKNYIKKKYSAKEVVTKNIVDEKIVGGIIIKVGYEVLDGSVSRQLIKLKKALRN